MRRYNLNTVRGVTELVGIVPDRTAGAGVGAVDETGVTVAGAAAV